MAPLASARYVARVYACVRYPWAVRAGTTEFRPTCQCAKRTRLSADDQRTRRDLVDHARTGGLAWDLLVVRGAC